LAFNHEEGIWREAVGHERIENQIGRISRTIWRTFECRHKSKNESCAKRCRTIPDDRGREAFESKGQTIWEESKRFRNKGDLLKELQSRGVSAKGRKDELQILCKQNNISIEEELDEVVEGWEGKPKGVLQILWERGFVDQLKKKEDYTLQGKKDAFGKVNPKTSLKHLVSLLTDFIEEETLLQYHGRLLKVKVVRTPKCNPEITGEGIQYDWGCGKGFYCCLPLSAKKTKIKFCESVKKSLHMNEVLTI
jgi:hypothetical protein